MYFNPVELGAGFLASLKLFRSRWKCRKLCQIENLAMVRLEKGWDDPYGRLSLYINTFQIIFSEENYQED